MAYADAEAGIYEVYVRAFPDRGAKVQISNAGGMMPVWSRNGHELFYRTEGQRIKVVNYTVKGGTFVADKPRVWSEKRIGDTGLNGINYDVASDGKRIAALMLGRGSGRPEGKEPRDLLAELFRRSAAESAGRQIAALPVATGISENGIT